MLFGTLVAETILASVHVRAHRQAGHMDASDLIKTLQKSLQGGGRPHMGLPHFGGAKNNVGLFLFRESRFMDRVIAPVVSAVSQKVPLD